MVSALESALYCTMVSFVSITIPTMRKTNNPYFGRVQKRTSVKRALFNATYIGYDENGNPLPKKEVGKEPLPWGVWRKFRKTIEHKGKVYMRCYFVPQTITKVEYLIDGVPATAEQTEEIKTYLYKSGEDKPDAHGKVTRAYDTTNIVYLKINKQEFRREDYENFPKVG